MAYADVEWVNLEVAPLTKFNQMLTNADHVRAEANFRPIAGGVMDGTGGGRASAVCGSASGTTGDAFFTLKVEEYLGGIGVWESVRFQNEIDTPVSIKNRDISSLPNYELHDVYVEAWARLDFFNPDTWLGFCVHTKLWKTPDDNFISLTGAGYSYAQRDIWGNIAPTYKLVMLQRFLLYTSRTAVTA